MYKDNGSRFDPEKAKALASIPTGEFSKIIESVVLSCGGTEASAKRTAANAGALQKMLANASDADLARLFTRLGPQAMKIVEESSKNGRGGNNR